MNTVIAQGTWGLTGPQFLTAYAALCAITAIWVWQRRLQVLDPRPRNRDPLPSLGLSQLAMLGGGEQLAITTAAAQLHEDGLLQVDAATGRLKATGTIELAGDPLEQAVLETVRDDPGIGVHALREVVGKGDVVRAMRARLTGIGLLVDERRSRALRRVWVVGALLSVLGAAWLLSSHDVRDGAFDAIVLLMLVVATATLWLARDRPLATHRGRAILARSRGERAELRHQPGRADGVVAAALFGGGALWLASPEVASALDVPREDGKAQCHGGCRAGGCSASGCGGGTSCAGGGGGGCGGGCGGG